MAINVPVPPHRAAAATVRRTISVVVPTYLRPDYLRGCLDSLVRQTRRPDEILVVMRADDTVTSEACREFVAGHPECSRAIVLVTVSEPGFLPPVIAGIANASGDIVGFIDDDAEALPDWLERLDSHYDDPLVGGVGGRCVNISEGREVLYPVAKRVGQFCWYGRTVGNMYREVEDVEPREADFFMGGNMSFRRAALERTPIDMRLNRDVAFNYEVDVGLRVKALGYRNIYDPQAKVRHYSAPRPTAGLRAPTAESVFWHSRNLLYITLKHTRGMHRLIAIVYSFLIGSGPAWGLASIVRRLARDRRLSVLRQLWPAWTGKWRAISETFFAHAQSTSS